MKRKILVVEDDSDTQVALGIQLRAVGVDTVFAVDGVQAVSAAMKERPDLILLDLGLPAGDGFHVLERLRALNATAAVPVIVLSARVAAANRERALRAGARAYLEKPVERKTLLATINTYLPDTTSVDGAPATRVLVIEDDDDTRRGLAMRLNSHGFKTSTAADATTGFAAALKSVPDAIVLDLGLPAGDGLDLLERFRSHPKLCQVPVLVLSARPATTNRKRAMAAGAVEYFEKPADNAALMVALRRATHTADETA